MPGRRKREREDCPSDETASDGDARATPTFPSRGGTAAAGAHLSETESNTDLDVRRQAKAAKRKRMRVKKGSPLSSPSTPGKASPPPSGVAPISPEGTPARERGAASSSRSRDESLQSVLEEVPHIDPVKLEQAATRMRGPVRLFLKTLGRDPEENSARSCAITIDPQRVSASLDVFNIRGFSIHRSEMDELASSTLLTLGQGKVKDNEPFLCLNSTRSSLTAREEMESHHIAVSGYVMSVFDNSYRPMHNSHVKYLCVSIPGINFMYSKPDKAAFTSKGAIREAPTRQTMRSIWGHTLSVMRVRGVEVPVLCAIGCGAFKGKFDGIPSLWAESLADELERQVGLDPMPLKAPGDPRTPLQPRRGAGRASGSRPFAAVFVSVPSFAGCDNHEAFGKVLAARAATLPCPVYVTKEHSMVSVASHLAASGVRSAILNPSDPLAVRCGTMGMYWDGGHTALEEILALQTTLLLQHVGLDGSLWRDHSRHYILSDDGTAVSRRHISGAYDEALEDTECYSEAAEDSDLPMLRAVANLPQKKRGR